MPSKHKRKRMNVEGVGNLAKDHPERSRRIILSGVEGNLRKVELNQEEDRINVCFTT